MMGFNFSIVRLGDGGWQEYHPVFLSPHEMTKGYAPQRQYFNAPTVVAGMNGGVLLTSDGELQTLGQDTLSLRISEYTLGNQPVLLCHAPTVKRQLRLSQLVAFDILQLWAFVRPAQFCVPTVAGVCRELGLPIPADSNDGTLKLLQIANILLDELSHLKQSCGGRGAEFTALCRMTAGMKKVHWPWANPVIDALGITPEHHKNEPLGTGLDVWNRLPEWEDNSPKREGGGHTVSEQDTERRLKDLLGKNAEIRQGQVDYAKALAQVFQGVAVTQQTCHQDYIPPLVLAEAGTGVGKTLGYIAPTSVWTEKNQSPVWISTYTRNLQHQIDRELDKLFPNPQEKQKRIVVRKGRENYVCLGRFEWAVRRLAIKPDTMVPLALLARWIMCCKDGDLNGSDFPSWLNQLIDPKGQIFYNLVVRYDDGGNHSDCSHSKKCFVDIIVKRANVADIVVMNHALILSQPAMGQLAVPQNTISQNLSATDTKETDDNTLQKQEKSSYENDGDTLFPTLIFDEGHHLFDATDSAYTVTLTARAGERLRQFIAPRETDMFQDTPDSNLKQLVGDAIADDTHAIQALDSLVKGVDFLVSDGWYKRLETGNTKGSMEWFLYHVARRVYSLDKGRNGPYSLECESIEIPPELAQAGQALLANLREVESPALNLIRALEQKLVTDSDTMDSHIRRSLRSASGQLRSRVVNPLVSWRAMISDVVEETNRDDNVVDRFVVMRHQSRDTDVGMVRSLVDPMQCFARGVIAQSQGVAITSATLTKGQDYQDNNWQWAITRTGACHHAINPVRVRVPSPFDYSKQTRIYVVDDVDNKKTHELAGAFQSLFRASGGGALGLFTAINRLQKVYETMAPIMEDEGLSLYAQHVDNLSLPTLIEMFRAEANSCLLGTDAVRDGVDVPGNSLRMIIFEKIPWQKPDILHNARKKHFGKGYDDALVSAKLKQAFGRLIRRQDDKGVFIILGALPSRLHDAFPEGVEIVRQGLSQTIQDVADFLNS